MLLVPGATVPVNVVIFEAFTTTLVLPSNPVKSVAAALPIFIVNVNASDVVEFVIVLFKFAAVSLLLLYLLRFLMY